MRRRRIIQLTTKRKVAVQQLEGADKRPVLAGELKPYRATTRIDLGGRTWPGGFPTQ